MSAINSRDARLLDIRRQRKQIDESIREALDQTFGKRQHISADGGLSLATPASDGKHVFALFYTGFATSAGVCFSYDLEGNRVWSRHIDEGGSNEHGYSGSPLVVGGKLIVLLQGFTALDAATGRIVWSTAPQRRAYATFGSMVAARVGDDAIVISSNGNCVRASDGSPMFTFTDRFKGECPSPVVDDGIWYNFDRSGVYAIKLPTNLKMSRDGSAPPATILKHVYTRSSYAISSPLYHQGLLYCVENRGTLKVVDPVAGEIVYTQELPLNGGGGHAGGNNSGVTSSPTLGGKHIFVWDQDGTCVVFEPGRNYKQVALNHIESIDYDYAEPHPADLISSCPCFDEGRIYLRGALALWCLGK